MRNVGVYKLLLTSCSFKKMSWEMLFCWCLRTNKICPMQCQLQRSQTN